MDYVLTGIDYKARAALDAMQARMARAADARASSEQIHALEEGSSGASTLRLVRLQAMLKTLRAVEFDSVYALVESIASQREMLEREHLPGLQQSKRAA